MSVHIKYIKKYIYIIYSMYVYYILLLFLLLYYIIIKFDTLVTNLGSTRVKIVTGETNFSKNQIIKCYMSKKKKEFQREKKKVLFDIYVSFEFYFIFFRFCNDKKKIFFFHSL